MENLYIVILAFISAVILGRIIIPNVLIISMRKRLFDVPDERKVHKRPVPRLGGVTFFPVILFQSVYLRPCGWCWASDRRRGRRRRRCLSFFS